MTQNLSNSSAVVSVRDENGTEFCVLYRSNLGSPVILGDQLRKIKGHFYYRPSHVDQGAVNVEDVVWGSVGDFAAWLTGYLKFYGSRRRRIAQRTSMESPETSFELRPAGWRPYQMWPSSGRSTFVYSFRPKPSKTKDGVHVNLRVTAVPPGDGVPFEVFNGNLHAFDPFIVQSAAYDRLDRG